MILCPSCGHDFVGTDFPGYCPCEESRLLFRRIGISASFGRVGPGPWDFRLGCKVDIHGRADYDPTGESVFEDVVRESLVRRILRS